MSKPPELVKYDTEEEYRRHYRRVYQMNKVFTHDGIRVYFDQDRFNHAFFKPRHGWTGRKELFDPSRAERIDWIKATLESPYGTIYQGWNKATKAYEPWGRVAVVFEAFVVVIRLQLQHDGNLKGKFVTCYVADASISKIKKSPIWDLEECMRAIKYGR